MSCHLLPSYCQERICPVKISFKTNEIKRKAPVYFVLYNSQSTFNLS